MHRRDGRIWRWLLCGVLLPAGGCGIVSSVLDPSLTSTLGLNLGAFTTPPGVVMITFKNSTSLPATFFAFEAADVNNLDAGRNFSVPVAAGQVGNEVVNCPVGAIYPGTVLASGALSGEAAILQGTGSVAVVGYAGGLLTAGQVYSCGDVVEIGVSQVAATDSSGNAVQSYVITVRVIPGG